MEYLIYRARLKTKVLKSDKVTTKGVYATGFPCFNYNCFPENNYRESTNYEIPYFRNNNKFQDTVNNIEKSIKENHFNDDLNEHISLKVKKMKNNFNIHDNAISLLKKRHNIKTKNVNDDKITEFNVRVNDVSTKVNEDGLEGPIEESKSGILTTDLDTAEQEFNLYEIGSPNLWYQVNVQLFEKISSRDGKTVWNDVIKDPSARYYSLHNLQHSH